MSAIISPCGTYRYQIERALPNPCGEGIVVWVMLNPSTADAENDDPTIRKVIGFSSNWGFAHAIVVNLYALRSTDWRPLRTHADPVGPENDAHIAEALRRADASVCGGVVLAWGAHAPDVDRARGTLRARKVRKLVRDLVIGEFVGALPMWTLGETKGGAPLHPLMLPYSTRRMQA